MPSTVQVAAVDLGASSGRVMLGQVGRHVLRLEPVARFANEPVRTPDGLHWNILELYRQSLAGLRAAAQRSTGLASIGIDSWAVDYGLMRDGRLLGMPYHYRDVRRARGADVVHALVPPDELHQRNGLQFLPFNSLYQLAADPLVELADGLLLVPDLLGHWLTGHATTERTNASTTGLLDVRTRSWDDKLIDILGLPRRILGDIVDPGTVLGPVLPEVADATGLAQVPVTTVGSHDTASAVVGVPMDCGAAYVSCGTWGLVGVELEQPVLSEASRLANFTNEGGVDGTVRFLTNVMGLWLLSESMRAWRRAGITDTLSELLAAAEALPGPAHTFDVQDPSFLPPGDLPTRIEQWHVAAGLEPPDNRPALVRAIVESLAQAFADAVDTAARLSRQPVTVVNVVGGGALNSMLCQALADRAGLPVLAGPVEATAIGNVLVQGRTAGALHGDLAALRHLVRQTHPPKRFTPRGSAGRMAR